MRGAQSAPLAWIGLNKYSILSVTKWSMKNSQHYTWQWENNLHNCFVCTQKWSVLEEQKINPIQARGHFVPPHKNHSTSSKRLGVWSYCFVNFLSMFFSIQKSFGSTNQPSCLLPWQPCNFLACFRKLESPMFFK